jgi:hypothetical protein
MAICLILVPGRVAALSLDELLGPDRAAVLLSTGTLTEVQLRDPRPALLPRHSYTQALINVSRETLDPGFLVESLFLYAKPAAGIWTDAERTALYNEALAVSSLAGIRYFSTTRNAMRILYETSGVIDGPETRNPRPDPVFASPPETLTLYARQKDTTFGENIYQYDYYTRPDALLFVQENLTTMMWGIIPAVGKNKLRSVVAVIDTGDHLLVYAAFMAKAASVPGMNRQMGASLSTRAEAILKWFAGRADKVFAGK